MARRLVPALAVLAGAALIFLAAPLAAKLQAPDKSTLKFKPASEYRYINKNVPVVHQKDTCDGKEIFGYDDTMPGMLVASEED